MSIAGVIAGQKRSPLSVPLPDTDPAGAGVVGEVGEVGKATATAVGGGVEGVKERSPLADLLYLRCEWAASRVVC